MLCPERNTSFELTRAVSNVRLAMGLHIECPSEHPATVGTWKRRNQRRDRGMSQTACIRHLRIVTLLAENFTYMGIASRFPLLSFWG